MEEGPLTFSALAARINSVQPGAAAFEHLETALEVISTPKSIVEWIEANGGPFRFFYGIEIDGEEIIGDFELNPARFKKLKSECRSWAEESWISDDEEQKGIWLQAWPFADLGNGDYLGFSQATSEDGPIVYLSHEDCSEIIAPSSGSFIKEWSRLYYVGPDIGVFEPFREAKTGYLDANLETALEFRNRFEEWMKR